MFPTLFFITFFVPASAFLPLSLPLLPPTKLNFEVIPNSPEDNIPEGDLSLKMVVDLPSGSVPRGNVAGGSEPLKAFFRAGPVLPVPSDFVEVRRRIPFELSVEPKNGLAVTTKGGSSPDTKGECERVGDVLRYCSNWSLGPPRGEGLGNSVSSISGQVKWQVGIFDVMKAKRWEEVVDALVSNTRERTDEVVLIFEREKGGGE